ncbi:amino acid adenylation domain-containing protein [Paenibacillus sp. FSL H7-0756]|uniref:amino acid adenylation domain-containing protein n=1 Tax=Paenibacillus sp. FSL H7-0756 TaxID=2954738 RepID=UPI0030FA0961
MQLQTNSETADLNGEWNDLEGERSQYAFMLHDYPYGRAQNWQSYQKQIGSEQGQALLRICKNNDLSVYIWIISVLGIVMRGSSGMGRMLIFAPLTQGERTHGHSGVLINSTVDGGMVFRDYLIQMKQEVLRNSYSHTIEAQKKVKQLLSTGENWPFRYQCRYDAIHGATEEDILPGNEISLSFQKINDSFTLTISYDEALFLHDSMQLLAERFLLVLEQTLVHPQFEIGGFSVLSEDEESRLLTQLSGNDGTTSPEQTVTGLFQLTAKRTPDCQAVVFKEKMLTYRELEERSDMVAINLRANGVSQGALVAVMASPSLELIVALLGILKTGCAYVPLDPKYPESRTRYMLEDSSAEVLLVNGYEERAAGLGFKGKVISYSLLESEELPEQQPQYQEIKPSDLAYVLYTSGSTGRPKGVMIEHRNVTGLVTDMNFISLRPGEDRLAMTGSAVFDITTFEIWASLLNGITLHVIDGDTLLDPDALVENIRHNRISVLHLVPQLFNRFALDHDSIFKNLRYFLIGGDTVRPYLLNRIRRKYPKLNICHMYGPTENTTFSSWMPVHQEYDGPIPVGRPVSNSVMYILDEAGQLCPIGTPGEIYVGGAGIARGYLNQPELTRERFVPNPFTGGERLYRTGDLGRWMTDGTVQFLGRNDQQVKIRGARVELTEVESRLAHFPGILEVVVQVREEHSDPISDKELAAYYVADSSVRRESLRTWAAAELPAFMVPSQFIEIEAVPLTPNGKADYKALREIRSKETVAIGQPRDDIDRKLIEIWEHILPNQTGLIGIDTRFFDAGGHSLRAISLVSLLSRHFHIQLPLAEILQNPTIRTLADFISEQKTAIHDPIPAAVPLEEGNVLSSAQKRLYFLQALHPLETAYHMTAVYKLEGRIDRDVLEAGFKALVNRHAILRTCFIRKGDEIRSYIMPESPFALVQMRCNEAEIEDAIKAAICPFDLEQAPLIRARLIEHGDNQVLLVVDLHHIAADGLSCQLLMNDLAVFWSGGVLPDPDKTYKDFVIWQTGRNRSTALESQRKYWMREFAGGIPVLDLATDFTRPDLLSHEGNAVAFTLPNTTVRLLSALSATADTTLFVILFGIWFLLLHKLTHQKDLVVGTVTAGRSHPDLEEMVGMFANTLPIRLGVQPENNFLNLLSQLKLKVIGALEHDEYQFEDMIDELQVHRNPAHNPLFDVMFTMSPKPAPVPGIPDMSVQIYPIKKQTSKFDLTLFAEEDAVTGNLHFELEYCSRLFKRSTINNYIRWFIHLAKLAAEYPEEPIARISLTGKESEEQLLDAYCGEWVALSGPATVQERFDECADSYPDNIAVSDAGQHWTYRELRLLTDLVADRLIRRGIRKGDKVALLLHNSVWLVAGMLGVLKAGGVYVPLDPEFPTERINGLLAASGSRLLLTEQDLAGRTWQVESLWIAGELELRETQGELLCAAGSAEDLIYIIYTSGSTGTPKGCLIRQEGVINYLDWAIRTYFNHPGIVVPLYTSPACDLTVTSIFGPLLSGHALEIYPRGIEVLQSIVTDKKVNLIKLTPSHLRLLNQLDCCESPLHTFIVGGEALTTELASTTRKNFKGNVRIINEYGPTETVVGCMVYEFDPHTNVKLSVPIGKPIQNMEVCILDESGNMCPVGVPGELHVSGVGVSPGYLNRTDLTEEKFIAHPWRGPYGRMYKTGDIALYAEEGWIEYRGRRDTQVKIRGYRVETEEVEHWLLQQPEVENAIVTAVQSPAGYLHLCAYLVTETIKNHSAWKKNLAAQLPDYMVPDYYVTLEDLPMMENGKVNRSLLPLPIWEAAGSKERTKSDGEKLVYDLWVKQLAVTEFGTEDNFFDIGGNSLTVLAVHSELVKIYPGLKVTDFFKYPTISSLCSYIALMDKEAQQEEDVEDNVNQDHCKSIDLVQFMESCFRLPEAVTSTLEALCQASRATLREAAAAVFACLWGDAAGRAMVSADTLIPDEYSGVVRMKFDFSGNPALPAMLEQACRLQEISSEALGVEVEGPEKELLIVPLIYWKDDIDICDCPADSYDVLVEMERSIGEGCLFRCRYNQAILDSQAADEIFHLYSGMLSAISQT